MAYSNSWVNSTPANTIAVATSPTANDVLIAYMVTDSGSAVTPSWPSGFTQIANLRTTTTDGQSLCVAIKGTASGSEGSLTLNDGNAAVDIIGGVGAWNSIDNTTPQDVTSVTGTALSDASSPFVISASITPSNNGCDIVAICGLDINGSINGTPTFSTTSGTTGAWTTRQDQNSGFYNVAVGTATQTTAGAITVQCSWTAASGSSDLAIVLIALRPAAGGGGTFQNLVGRPFSLAGVHGLAGD